MLLSRASALNRRVQSPRVPQYVANIAAVEKDLFLAVQAQREALRLDPGNALYRRNLETLLQTDFNTLDQRGSSP